VGATFVIALREGIEASLIVSILLAYLKKIERPDGRGAVWAGTLVAAAVSAGIGAVLFSIGAEFEGRPEQIFVGVVTLLAVAVLTWMIVWMRTQGGRMRAELHGRVDTAILGGGLALAAMAFLAVLREGVETALFLFAAARGTATAGDAASVQIAGALLGLLVAVALGVLLYRGGIRLDLRTFFRVTGLALIVIAAGLLGYGIHELQDAGILPVLAGRALDLSGLLPDDAGLGALLRALVGYHATPSVLEAIAWFGYIAIVGRAFLRPVAAPTTERVAVS
jgi:high-affinity iron transporter